MFQNFIITSCIFSISTRIIILIKNIKIIFKKYIFQFLAIVFFISSTTSLTASNVLLLFGSSTSGKTTIINQLLEKTDRFENYGLDFRVLIEGGHQIKEHYPIEYQSLIEVIPHDEIVRVVFGQFNLISDLSICEDTKKNALTAGKKLYRKICLNQYESEDEKNLIKPLYPLIINRLKEAVDQKKSLLIDCSKIKQWQDIEQALENSDIKRFLIFCPFIKLSERMQHRNAAAIKINAFFDRREQTPLWQYASLYCKRENKNQPILETLSKTTVEDIFDKFLQEPNKFSLSFIESIGLSGHSKNDFLSYLGFSEEEEFIEITTRFDSKDFLILNVTEYTPAEIADFILKKAR